MNNLLNCCDQKKKVKEETELLTEVDVVQTVVNGLTVTVYDATLLEHSTVNMNYFERGPVIKKQKIACFHHEGKSNL